MTRKKPEAAENCFPKDRQQPNRPRTRQPSRESSVWLGMLAASDGEMGSSATSVSSQTTRII